MRRFGIVVACLGGLAVMGGCHGSLADLRAKAGESSPADPGTRVGSATLAGAGAGAAVGGAIAGAAGLAPGALLGAAAGAGAGAQVATGLPY